MSKIAMSVLTWTCPRTETLSKCFVKFPAVLMATKDGEDNYSKIADFSKMDVSKLPVFVDKWSYLERSAKLI